MTFDEAIEKAKADGDVQLAEWLRQARGADAAARWYTEKLRDLEDENTRLRSWLSYDADNARQIMSENAKLRELVRAAWGCIHSGLSCSDCRLIAGGCTLQSAMRELRVEVEG